jgi:hypothetical protein
MATATASPDLLDGLRHKWPIYATNCLQIVTKQAHRVPFEPNPAQIALDEKLEEQRLAGLPQRAIVLKARQVGISTYAQGKLLQRCTLNEHHSALVVAHNLETGAKLYRIGRTMYSHLPAEEVSGWKLRPQIGAHKRTRYMLFSDPAPDAWQRGEPGLESEYLVSTAEEPEAGRGGTYRSFHGSEVAMWPDIEGKLAAILAAVPNDPDTLVILESTAKGLNAFKDRWDAAVAGQGGFIPFFWPWWKHDEYQLAFLDDAERREFRIGDIEQSPYAEAETLLVDPGPLDPLTGEHVSLSLEQLKWRRHVIPAECGGSIDKFNQEYPTEPEDAFLSTGSNVFEPVHVRSIIKQVGPLTPQIGALEAETRETRAGRFGKVEVPVRPRWKEAKDLLPGVNPDWKLWIDLERDEETKLFRPPKDGLYVIGVDVSGGVAESEDSKGEPAKHAIEVIDHRTREQVAEYSSRCDPDLLAEHAYLTALYFNEAWLAIEVTGSWGLPIARKIGMDWRYRFSYRRKTHERTEDREQDRLGWDTNRATKPILLALGQEIVRGERHGIRSVHLAREMLSYIQLPTGKTAPESGKFADRLMAWLIARQVAQELPLRVRKPKTPSSGYRPKNPITGY